MNANWPRRRRDVGGRPPRRRAETSLCTVILTLVPGTVLTIEARRLSRAPVYHVHWAGGHTDGPAGECGTAAELVLERTELMRLANVADGPNSGLRLIGP